MKKIAVIVLVLICFISLGGCNNLDLIEVNGKQYLVLPISKEKVLVWEHEKEYLDDVNLDLLKAAEEKILSQTAQYEDDPNFSLTYMEDEGYLCLSAEVIVRFDPPSTSETLPPGCGKDHEHKFFHERITKP